MGLRLFCGLLPHGVPASLQCKCGKELSVPHVLACRKLRARIMRHDAIVDDLLAWLRTDRGVSVFKEVMHIGRMDGNQRIDLLVRCGGIAYWGDVSVSEPANPSYLPILFKKKGYAVKKSEGMKTTKWKDIAPTGAVVQPLCLETTGHMGPALLAFLKTMEKGSKSTVATSCRARSRNDLMTQLSVTMVRYNVQCMREAIDCGPLR